MSVGTGEILADAPTIKAKKAQMLIKV